MIKLKSLDELLSGKGHFQLVETINELNDTLERYEGLCGRQQLKIEELKADRDRLRGALADYGEHRDRCPLAHWEAGRPTDDGGYETKYAGKWYKRGDDPACTCGFDAALAEKEKPE